MKKLGLIAGNGKFPLIFAAEAKRAGYSVIAVAHRSETPDEIENIADRVDWIYVGQLGKMIRLFQRNAVSEAVMAGGIRKIKLFGNFRPDLRGVRFLAKLKSREDDALLRGIADELALDGIKILDSTLCVPQIICATRPDGGNIYFYQRWVEYTGLTLADSLGHLWMKHFHPDD